MAFILIMSDDKTQKVEKLYQEYGRLVLRSLKLEFDLQLEEAEEILQETFLKAFSNIQRVIGGIIFVRARGGIIKPVLNENAWIFKIARNTALHFINQKKLMVTNQHGKDEDEEGNDFFDGLASPEPGPGTTVDEDEQKICIVKCYRDILEKLCPHAIYPLVIALCELETPVEKIADVIARSVPETEKLLKKCHKEMKALKLARGKKSERSKQQNILEQCREEKVGYQDYYNDYQAKHSRQEGAGSLCWLVAELSAAEMTMEEISQLINKDKKTTQRIWQRCFEVINEEVEKCLRQNCGW